MIQLMFDFSLNVEAEIPILLVSNLLTYMHLDWNFGVRLKYIAA